MIEPDLDTYLRRVKRRIAGQRTPRPTASVVGSGPGLPATASVAQKPPRRPVTAYELRQRRAWGKGGPYRGVYPVPSGRWAAKARVDGVLLRLGTFDDEASAARAYDAAVRRLPGATLNFPEEAR